MNDQQDNITYNERYQSFVEDVIRQVKERIQADTGLAQSNKGQKLLSGLSDPKSQIYIDAVKRAIENEITRIQKEPYPSTDDHYLIYILKRRQQSETNIPKLGQREVIQLEVGQIPNEIMLETVEKIICGHTRIHIAKHFLDQEPMPEWLLPLAVMDKTEATHLLSQRLRQADPTSNKFSRTKYGAHADAVKQEVFSVLQKHVYNLIKQQIDDFERTDADFVKRIADAQKAIEETRENPTENRQNVKLWMALNKQRDERSHRYLTHFHNILAAHDAGSEDSATYT